MCQEAGDNLSTALSSLCLPRSLFSVVTNSAAFARREAHWLTDSVCVFTFLGLAPAFQAFGGRASCERRGQSKKSNEGVFQDSQ